MINNFDYEHDYDHLISDDDLYDDIQKAGQIKFGKFVKSKFFWLHRTLKSGKQSKRGMFSAWYYYTPINTCECCGAISTPRKVRHRGGMWGWDIENKKGWSPNVREGILCMGCWNRLRPIVAIREECEESRKFINRLNTELRKLCQAN